MVSSAPLNGNYLRVRGEYLAPKLGIGWAGELPPRARRIRILIHDLEAVEGTTSACAENTPDCNTHHTTPWNYLRVRGEYL